MYGKTVPDSGFSSDDGSADPEVTQAVGAYAAGRLGKSELVEALTNRRLLVAVIATVLGKEEAGEPRAWVDSRTGRGFQLEKATDVMLITIKATDGRVALPAFTSLDALSRWQPGVRPVPASTRRVCAGAVSEGADLVVIDPAGPATVELSGAVLWALAEGRAMLPLAEDPAVIKAIRAASEEMARAFSGTFLEPGADERTALVIQLVARAGVDPAEVRDAAAQLASRLAADPIMRSRVDGGVQIAVVKAPPPAAPRI